METEFIVCLTDNTWRREVVEIPVGVIPEKLYLGSAKWKAKAIAWATKEFQEENVEYIGILKAKLED